MELTLLETRRWRKPELGVGGPSNSLGMGPENPEVECELHVMRARGHGGLVARVRGDGEDPRGSLGLCRGAGAARSRSQTELLSATEEAERGRSCPGSCWRPRWMGLGLAAVARWKAPRREL